MGRPAGTAKAQPRRVRGTREDTESQVLDAVMRLLRRDGVLAGITLREVATEAGVNHGQIYQYFGTRQRLVRAALNRLVSAARPDPSRHWRLPFVPRRLAMWDRVLRQPDYIKLMAVLALDNDPDLIVFPQLELTREALARDVADGELDDGVDPDVAHAMTASAYFGYAIFRETFARELGREPADLDRAARAIFERMVRGISRPAPE